MQQIAKPVASPASRVTLAHLFEMDSWAMDNSWWSCAEVRNAGGAQLSVQGKRIQMLIGV